jgi:hypothetical protein
VSKPSRISLRNIRCLCPSARTGRCRARRRGKASEHVSDATTGRAHDRRHEMLIVSDSRLAGLLRVDARPPCMRRPTRQHGAPRATPAAPARHRPAVPPFASGTIVSSRLGKPLLWWRHCPVIGTVSEHAGMLRSGSERGTPITRVTASCAGCALFAYQLLWRLWKWHRNGLATVSQTFARRLDYQRRPYRPERRGHDAFTSSPI